MVEEKEKIKTLQEDIALLESYAQDLFSFTPLPLCFVNPKGMILEVNPAFIKVTGYDEYDVIGKSISTLMKEEDAEEIIRRTIEEGDLGNLESTIKDKEGNELPVGVFTKSREVKGEGVNGIFFSFFDLSKIKEKEKKLREKMEEMEKFHRFTVGREERMVELKEEIERLKRKLKKSKEENK